MRLAGSSAALGLASVLIAVTVVSVAIAGGYLSWLPVDASVHGPGLDRQLTLTILVTGVLFVLAQLALARAVWKYRDRGNGRRMSRARENGKIEAAWTIALAALFISLSFVGYRVWAQMYLVPAPAGAMQIEVQGEQFAYSFRYPGPDGKFGPIHAERIDDAQGNPFGLDRERDPNAKDDIVTATLGVPAGRPIELLLLSRDVVHSFDVRELRVQQDMLPGVEIPIHFTATRTGEYEIVCTQLCGLGHYRMRAFLEVMPATQFDEWLETQAAHQ